MSCCSAVVVGAVKVKVEAERARGLVAPALEHIIKLEEYFRVHGLDPIATRLEATLQECELIMTGAKPHGGAPADGSGDAPPTVGQDPQRYNAELTPETGGRAALG